MITTKFASMTDFLTRATVGDTYAEPQRPGSREITTYRLARRLTSEDTNHAQRGDGGEVEALTTEHRGAPQYAYCSHISTNQHYTDGTFVSIIIGHGNSTTGRNGTHSTDPAKRLSTKNLRARHHRAVTELFGTNADQSNTD